MAGRGRISKKLLMGNEAMARGLLERGCAIATSYPGTPASEILSSLVAWRGASGAKLHAQWAINEKVAFEISYAASMTGVRSAVSMKQVGLNVASDPLMSAAYMGCRGGFVVISADDPGPHSSQTEQDSRLMAMTARIPVLDPSSPAQAREMIHLAYELSETFSLPVMVRPTTRVCHARQDVALEVPVRLRRRASFERNPSRWAATPRHRLTLHKELEEKLERLAGYAKSAPVLLNRTARTEERAVVASGVAAAHGAEILVDLGLWKKIPLYQVLQPFPLHREFIERLLSRHREILVLEETAPVIEMQLADRWRVRGRMDGRVPSVGELVPEKIRDIVAVFAGLDAEGLETVVHPGRRPTLCAGCPHRAAFFAMKRAAPKGIYTSDIGCYTLGVNLGAVDTCLCMGAAIGQAAGLYQAFRGDPERPDIIATMGDSTFFHAGIPSLIDAVVQGVSFVLLILDNGTTAMTGGQPTPATGVGADGEQVGSVAIEAIVKGCGVRFCKVGDPYDVRGFSGLLREAVRFTRETGGPSVVISRRPCPLIANRSAGIARGKAVRVDEACDGCGYCLKQFECPALAQDDRTGRVRVDPVLCVGCGVCLEVCPKKKIRKVQPSGGRGSAKGGAS